MIEKGKAGEFASHTHLVFACVWTPFKEEAEACLSMCVCRLVGGWVCFLFVARISSRGHLTSALKHDLTKYCITDFHQCFF